jgi:hypothetical protein
MVIICMLLLWYCGGACFVKIGYVGYKFVGCDMNCAVYNCLKTLSVDLVFLCFLMQRNISSRLK